MLAIKNKEMKDLLSHDIRSDNLNKNEHRFFNETIDSCQRTYTELPSDN